MFSYLAFGVMNGREQEPRVSDDEESYEIYPSIADMRRVLYLEYLSSDDSVGSSIDRSLDSDFDRYQAPFRASYRELKETIGREARDKFTRFVQVANESCGLPEWDLQPSSLYLAHNLLLQSFLDRANRESCSTPEPRQTKRRRREFKSRFGDIGRTFLRNVNHQRRRANQPQWNLEISTLTEDEWKVWFNLVRNKFGDDNNARNR